MHIAIQHNKLDIVKYLHLQGFNINYKANNILIIILFGLLFILLARTTFLILFSILLKTMQTSILTMAVYLLHFYMDSTPYCSKKQQSFYCYLLDPSWIYCEFHNQRNLYNLFLITPLHLAIRNGHIEIVRSLFENGADINAKTNSYNTQMS